MRQSHKRLGDMASCGGGGRMEVGRIGCSEGRIMPGKGVEMMAGSTMYPNLSSGLAAEHGPPQVNTC